MALIVMDPGRQQRDPETEFLEQAREEKVQLVAESATAPMNDLLGERRRIQTERDTGPYVDVLEYNLLLMGRLQPAQGREVGSVGTPDPDSTKVFSDDHADPVLTGLACQVSTGVLA